MSRIILGSIAPALLLLATGAVTGCKKEEPPPPLPSAAPVATAPPAPLQLKPIDAGAPPAPSASAKPVGHGSGGGGLGPCCAALAQNAASAPEPTKSYMVQAAAMCSSFAAQGRDKAALAGILMGILRGAGMPTACK